MDTVVREERTGRRSFLGYLIAAIGAFIASALGASTAIFAASPLLSERRGVRVALGPVSDFPMGEPRLVGFRLERKDGWIVEETSKSVWVVRTGVDSFITYSPRCTHLGCIVSWIPQEQVFRSPCHNGVFGLEGEVRGGPPPRPLDRLDHWIENGKLVVDYREFRLGIPEKVEA